MSRKLESRTSVPERKQGSDRSPAPPNGASGGREHLGGNFAMQRFVRASLRVGRADDAHEIEADHMAERVASAPCGGCSAAAPCAACHAKDVQLRRKASTGATPGTLPIPAAWLARLGSGYPLDSATRTRMQRHFGRDLSRVRVHSGDDAAGSARLIQARAFTAGSDIVFDRGEYRPGTGDGDRLIAHELTHVVQEGNEPAPTVRREVHGDPRHLCVTPKWAQALTDAELVEQEKLLENYLLAETSLLAGTPDYKTAQMNIQVLQDEYRTRLLRQSGFGPSPMFGAAPTPTVPRPPGLPLMQGYTLQELPNVPADVAARLPDGQLVDVPPGFLEGAGGGSYAGLRGANAALMNYGFASGGDFAIGIVAIPPANMNPLSPNFNPIDLAAPLERAGHSAIYVRQGGKITIVRGYNPQMSTPSSFWNVAKNQGQIFSGKMGVPGEITADAPLFQSTAARTIEFPVTEEVAAKLAAELPALGPPGAGQPPLYTAPPSEYGRITGTQPGCVGTNCGLWATQQAEAALGGRIGVAGEPPIVDVPVAGQASQGKLYGMLGRVREGAPMAEMPGATGPAVGGGMSTGLTLLKWGGRVFMVASAAKLGYDIWNAPPGEKAHVAVVGGAGILGGFAAGAALGLACGPGAPVCSIITGIIGGILGGLGASSIAESLWHAPDLFRSIQWLSGHENPFDKEYFERQDRIKYQRAMGQLTEEDY